jgi:hypothetical protein
MNNPDYEKQDSDFKEPVKRPIEKLNFEFLIFKPSFLVRLFFNLLDQFGIKLIVIGHQFSERVS